MCVRCADLYCCLKKLLTPPQYGPSSLYKTFFPVVALFQTQSDPGCVVPLLLLCPPSSTIVALGAC